MTVFSYCSAGDWLEGRQAQIELMARNGQAQPQLAYAPRRHERNECSRGMVFDVIAGNLERPHEFILRGRPCGVARASWGRSPMAAHAPPTGIGS